MIPMPPQAANRADLRKKCYVFAGMSVNLGYVFGGRIDAPHR
jgi:hypothetical protein